LQRHLEAGGKARQGAAPDAEGGARGGCWWDGGQVNQTLDAVLSKGQTMPEKNRFPAVLQPVPFTKAKRAQTVTDDETWVQGQVNPTLSLFDQGDTRATTVAVAFPWQSALDPIGKPDDVCGTLIKNQVMGVAHSLRADGFDASEDGTGRGTPLVPVAPSLTATNDPSRSPQSSEVTQQVAAVHASTMTVRRLSPRECERLQAFPDDWTLIPWRGKPAEQCPDGPRYKALGNSMACNCMAWIGEQIAKWEADHA
jgi:DNA (cytosine-5)-methyltransferase 1